MRTILILGTPRSGTSWLAKTFDSHPMVVFRNEPDELLSSGELPPSAKAEEASRYSAEVANFFERLVDVRTTKTVGGLPVFRKAYRSSAAHALRLGWIAALRALEVSSVGVKAARNLPIPEFMSGRHRDALVTVIKSVSLVDRAGLLTRADAGLRTILIVRHPCASVASALRGLQASKFLNDAWGPRIVETDGAKRRGLTREQFRVMPRYEQIAWHWLLQNEKAVAELSECANARIVTYHEIVAEAEQMARRLFAFAGLSWDPQTAQFLRDSQNGSSNNRYYGVYRTADFKQRADSWSDVIEPAHAKRIMEIVADSAAGRLFA